MLSPPAQIVRRHDPDRFLATLFAPAGLREILFTLFALNHELARAREVTSQPMLTLIRLQWWREVIEGADKPHEVATPLRAAIAAGALRADTLLPLVAAREIEADPVIPTLAVWRDTLFEGPGGLMVAAGQALGAADTLHPALRLLGAAYGAAGHLRSVPALAGQGRCLLPSDLLSQHGLTPDDVIAAPDAPMLGPVLMVLRDMALGWLREGRAARLPRPVLPAALPAVLARGDLQTTRTGPRGLGARLQVVRAVLRGRV